MIRRLIAFVGLLILATAIDAKAGVIYDVQTDYSSTINTNTSPWSYRFGSTAAGRVGNYSLMTIPPGSGADSGLSYTPLGTTMPVWNAAPTGALPLIGKNETGVAQNLNGTNFFWQPDDVLLHPGGSTYAVVSWLSPDDGTIDLQFEISDAETRAGDDGAAWFVELNDLSNTLASGAFGPGGSSGPISLPGINVNAGDRINFIVQSTGGLFTDTTRLEATIDANFATASVPEPSGLLIFAVSLAIGLAASLYVRKRKTVTRVATSAG